ASEALQQLVRRREVAGVGLVELRAAQRAGAELRCARVQQQHEIGLDAALREVFGRVDHEREPVAEPPRVAGGEVPHAARRGKNCGHAYFLYALAGWPRISPSGAFTPISFIAFASGSGLIAFCGISGDSITLIECRN